MRFPIRGKKNELNVMFGTVVGCDHRQEWLLPWWWKHYSSHNEYPVACIDLGMSEEGIRWFQKRGECISLSVEERLEEEIDPKTREIWEKRLGKDFWISRAAWLKKPFALLHSPFPFGLWLDLDCQVKGNLEPLFQTLFLGIDLAMVRDEAQNLHSLLPQEILYNSGVILFRQKAPILEKWAESIVCSQSLLPGDQEFLSRVIFQHKPPFFELPAIYNWPRTGGPNEKAIIHHFFGAKGKIEIISSHEIHTSDPELLPLR